MSNTLPTPIDLAEYMSACSAPVRHRDGPDKHTLLPTLPIGSTSMVGAVESATGTEQHVTREQGDVETVGKPVKPVIRRGRRRKRMSEKQLAANRRNGRKSRGPVTREGKKRSRPGA